MRPWRWFNLFILLGFLIGCSGSIREAGYLQEYGSQGGRGQGFRAAPYQVTEEAHKCVAGEVNGRINRIRVESFSSGMEPGLGLDVQTPDQGLVHVHCGPLKLLQCQESDLKPGDNVTMKVFCYKLSEGQESLFASEITHGGETLILRDSQGNPVWGICRKK